MTLQEFLHEQAEPLRREAAAREARIEAWSKSVDRLFDQVTQWIKDADPEGLIRVDRQPMASDENGEFSLHSHRFSRLTISLGDRVVHATPMIGEVIGPGIRWPKEKELRGRVDLANVYGNSMLYCLVDPVGEESWTLIDGRTFETRPLTRESFEATLVSLLR